MQAATDVNGLQMFLRKSISLEVKRYVSFVSGCLSLYYGDTDERPSTQNLIQTYPQVHGPVLVEDCSGWSVL